MKTVYKGCIDTAVIRPIEVFSPAIRHNARAILLGHNHPSGDVLPSAKDVSVTRDLVKAGKLLGVDILDHLIVSQDAFLSLKEKGWGFDLYE